MLLRGQWPSCWTVLGSLRVLRHHQNDDDWEAADCGCGNGSCVLFCPALHQPRYEFPMTPFESPVNRYRVVVSKPVLNGVSVIGHKVVRGIPRSHDRTLRLT